MTLSLLKVKHFGDSMQPSLQRNDFVFIDLSIKKFNQGDIVYFKDLVTNEFVSHRVIDDAFFLTKGDRNLFADERSKVLMLGVVVGFIRNNKIYNWGVRGQNCKLLFAFFSKYSESKYPKIIRYFAQVCIYVLNLLS